MSRIIASQADWRGPDLLKRDDIFYTLSGAEQDEIRQSIRAAIKAGVDFDTITRENFPLPKFGKVLTHTLGQLEDGPGLSILRGIPVADFSKDEARLIYWGLGKHLGTAVSQSKDGDLLGDVRDFGVDVNAPNGRGYRSRQKLSFHTDSCDVVGLMVLRVAKSGGKSVLASSTAVHNEIARTRPDMLEVLYEPMPWSWNQQEPPGGSPWYMQPLFSEKNGKISCRYIRGQIVNSQRYPDAPRLTDKQNEAMDCFDAIAHSEAFQFGMMFEPGDVQLLNNHVVLHSRTEFHDWPEEDRKRHLLRMWMSVPNSRDLSPLMGTIYQNQKGGAVRGGFPSRTGKHVYSTMMAVKTD